MNVIEAIKTRKSIRGYRPDPVPREVLRQILSVAGRSPSAMNSQPWEFAVLGGDVLDRVREANLARLRDGIPPAEEHSVTGWSKESVYRTRQVELAKGLFQLMGIERHDAAKRARWLERGFRFFDAPAAIIVLTDKSLKLETPLIDIGIVIQSICLAALEYDLGTCIEDQGCMYPDVLRELADIPDTKRIVMAIAIGYPDRDFPANRIQTTRVPIDEITLWRGI
ncbi:MAG TPA: nitroreductase [Desulfobacteraceae bacterium]|nr:nitroreductase [Deltaproteobacteria bacterium]HDI60457.1 nitroreductase [Desulfobacteraceae bacterium]